MIVLHAHWRPPRDPEDSGTLQFWAEDAAPPSPPGSAGSHPFTASSQTIAQRLASIGACPEACLDSAWAETFLLSLPSHAGNPMASPFLLRETDKDGDPLGSVSEDHPDTRMQLEAWAIESWCLEPAEGIEALARLPEAAALPPDLKLGDDLRFWRACAMLLLESLSLQKLLPGLVALPGPTWQARWLPVLDGEADAPRLRRLADAMPAICRADGSADEPPAPQALIESFLSASCDALVRRGLRIPSTPSSSPIPNSSSTRAASSNAARAWLQALLEGPALLGTSAARADHLHHAHQSWLQGLKLAGDAHARVAFRLQSPDRDDGPDEPWRLHFLLQARDDPSLLLPAQAVWDAGDEGIAAFGRRFERPEEMLLAGLGYASRFAPSIRKALRRKRPAHAKMSAEEAFDFLKYAAPLLEQSGFGILVPPWWNRPGSRLGLKLQIRPESRGSGSGSGSGSDSVAESVLGLESLAAFDWQLSLGGEALSEAEFAELVALKSPLVKLRGDWVQLDPFQVDAALRFWKRRTEAIDMLDALAYGLGAIEEEEGLPIESVEMESSLAVWVDRLRGEAELEPIAPPEGLHAQLRPYQQRGLDWLVFLQKSGLGGILADDMGLGKTIQTLSLIQHLQEAGQLDGPVLLVCPTSVVTNWARECARFTPDLRLYAHQGPGRASGEAFTAEAAGSTIVATSFALLRRDLADFDGIDYSGIVVDEAQNIKNPDAQQSRALRSLRSGWRLALTGTPVENRLAELWSIVNFTTPGHLGNRSAFRREMAIPIERHGDERALRRLRRLTRPLILRRLKTDPAVAPDLPDKVETLVYCRLTKEQASLYASVVEEALETVEESEGIERRGRVLSMLTRLKQICDHPALFLGEASAAPGTGARARLQLPSSALDPRRSQKLARLLALVEEASESGEASLVFSQYASMGRILRAALQARLGREVIFLHGGLSPKQRTRLVDRFQDPTGPPVFVLSLKAAGTGLNLTRASQVFHYDRWWNPAVEDQATDRAYRIGQRRKVLVHKFVCLGTLEERIMEMIERKRGLAERAVGSGEGWLGDLTNADLKALVELREESFR